MRHNLSEISAAIKGRRTIKPETFSSRKVHKEIITNLLDHAKWAPTHGMTQPWRFTVFMNDGLKKLSQFQSGLYKEVTPHELFFQRKYDKLKERPLLCSAVIAIGMKRQEIEKIPEVEEIESVACAVQNMHILATAYGLACYWGTGTLVYQDKFKDFLGLGEKDRCLGLFHIGYPGEEWPEGQRRPVEYFTTWID